MAVKASISFGLVYIPVSLHVAVRSNGVDFRLLDKKTMSKVRYLKTCDECDGRTVEQKDIVKAYEYEKGKFVVFSDEDFEKLKTPKDKTITIEKFVGLEEIDPIYFDKPYYVAPEGADKAYAVLVAAMEKEKKAGIARCVLGNKETLAALRTKDGTLLLNTMYFDEEVQKNPVKLNSESGEKELSLARTVINSMSGKFEPTEFKDEYNERLLKAIDGKVKGKEIKSLGGSKPQKTMDLVDALRRSVLQIGKAVKGRGNDKAGRQGRKNQKTRLKTTLPTANCRRHCCFFVYSTVTDLARFLGLSTFRPSSFAAW